MTAGEIKINKNIIIFGIVNFLAATLSGASGGGGGLISTPFMVVLGLSPAQAIATAKFGGAGISLGASGRFLREKITDRRSIIIFSVLGAIGAVFGSLVLLHFKDHTDAIQRLMGLTILFVGVPLLYMRNAGLKATPKPVWLKVIGSILIGFSVFLQAALSSGIGSLQMVVFITCFGMTALTASATRRFMQLSVALVSLAVYITGGLIDYRFGIMGLVTSLLGGFLGAHIAIKKGNKFVVNIFALVSVLLALQLIFSQ